MTSSLVGSEMCIRDRWKAYHQQLNHVQTWVRSSQCSPPIAAGPYDKQTPVSYTHLTLPTICSV
eukprot:11647278-Prorocentrum_lima.AAC.1